MTNTRVADGLAVIGPSQSPRTANTLRLQVLMEETERLAMAQRIKELREQSRFNQPQIADKLGIGLRAYQKLERRGTTKWERAEELAAIHEVDPFWIWSGKERGPTPDVMGELHGDDRVGELVSGLATLTAEVSALRTAQERLLSRLERGEGGQEDVGR